MLDEICAEPASLIALHARTSANASKGQKVSFDETLDLYDFGVRESIAAPPASQTVDFTSLLSQLSQGRGLGRTGP